MTALSDNSTILSLPRFTPAENRREATGPKFRGRLEHREPDGRRGEADTIHDLHPTRVSGTGGDRGPAGGLAADRPH